MTFTDSTSTGFALISLYQQADDIFGGFLATDYFVCTLTTTCNIYMATSMVNAYVENGLRFASVCNACNNVLVAMLCGLRITGFQRLGNRASKLYKQICLDLQQIR